MITALTAICLTWQSNPNNKLDTALQTATGLQPIFVRMENQLFKKGGDFEAFCKANENTPRSKVSQQVLSTLKSNSSKDWEQIKSFVSEWEAKEQISDVQRFWIVNGFACDATAEACKALASRSDVSFVYLQTGPTGLRQHRQRRRNSEPSEANKAAMQKGFAEQKDDTDKPFSTNGLEIPWDIKQIQVDQVWEKEGITGKGTIVAINDGGAFQIPALESALWRNKQETLDGKDNDNNGYVDDIFGWDTAGQHGYVLGNPGVHHGTFCSAIVGGRPTSEKNLVTGVAPRSQLMLINGMGYIGGFEYALDNGADVFSMSYMFVNMEIGMSSVLRLSTQRRQECCSAGERATLPIVLRKASRSQFRKTFRAYFLRRARRRMARDQISVVRGQ